MGGLVGAQQPAEPGGQAFVVANVAAAANETGLEVERGEAPQGPPPAREDLGAGAVLGGEERDDAAKNLVGEAADQVVVGAAVSCSSSGRHSLAPPPLLASRILLRHHDRDSLNPGCNVRNWEKIISSRPSKKTPIQDHRGDDARTWWRSAAS
jgi:hypothetical protein